MFLYIARRILCGMATIAVIVIVTFVATRLSGDALDYMMPNGIDSDLRAQLASYLGIGEPIWVQFWRFARGMFAGDFGVSLYERRPVAEIYAERLPNTLLLFTSGFLVSVALGLPLAAAIAVKRRSLPLKIITVMVFVAYATPNFVLAIGLILIFSFTLGWFPSSGAGTWQHFVLPTVALSAALLAETVRFTRSAVVEVLPEDYVRTAWSKGLSEAQVLRGHVFPNAAIPLVTVLGLQVAGMVGKVVFVEAVFATHGIGDLLVNAVIWRDYPVLQFGVILIAGLVVVVSLLVDAAYMALDPRITVGS